MRAAGLSAFAALLGLHTLGVQGETTCHTDHQLAEWSVADLAKLQDALAGPVIELCNKVLVPEENEIVTHVVGDVTFEIVRPDTTQDAEECKEAFADILKQCVGGSNVGGEVMSDSGVAYEVFRTSADHDDEEDDLEARDQAFMDVSEDELDELLEMVEKGQKLEARKSKAKKPKPKPVSTKMRIFYINLLTLYRNLSLSPPPSL
jgi:hypothetical protein